MIKRINILFLNLIFTYGFAQNTTNLNPYGDFELFSCNTNNLIPFSNGIIINNYCIDTSCRITTTISGNNKLEKLLGYYAENKINDTTFNKEFRSIPLKLPLIQNTVVNCNYAIKYYLHPRRFLLNTCYISPNSTTKASFESNKISGLFTNIQNSTLIDKRTEILYNDTFFLTPNDTISNNTTLNYTQHQIKGNLDIYDYEWTLTIDSFLSDSIYSFFYLGYFDSIQNYIYNLNMFIIDTPFYNLHKLYSSTYYLDDISIIPIGFENLSLLIDDTSLCNSSSININAYNPQFISYQWSNGDTTANTVIDTAGKYWLTAYYPCGYLSDTFYVSERTPSNLLSYGDTLAICLLNLPITLNAADTFASYSWSNSDTTFSTSFNQEGMVYLETQHFCGTLRDSVYLKLKDKENIDLIPFTDTLICASDLPFDLQINDTLQNYLWSNGATTFQNTFDAAGTYFVSADNSCHNYTDTFTLQTENLEAGNYKHQNIYCPEDFPITLTAPSTLNPNWNTGENANSITINNAVNDVYVHNSFSAVCGNRTDSFFVYVLPDTITSLPQILIDDFCLEEGFHQFSTIVNDTNFVYQWENQTSLNFTTKGGTTQTLSISNACLSLEIDTFIERCPEQIAFALPTAFSPNNDGVNDLFQLLYLNPNFSLKSLKIYNRWGEIVFNSNDKTIGWNGTYKSKNAPIGNYIYHLELQNENQETEIFKGNLNLIR